MTCYIFRSHRTAVAQIIFSIAVNQLTGCLYSPDSSTGSSDRHASQSGEPFLIVPGDLHNSMYGPAPIVRVGDDTVQYDGKPVILSSSRYHKASLEFLLELSEPNVKGHLEERQIPPECIFSVYCLHPKDKAPFCKPRNSLNQPEAPPSTGSGEQPGILDPNNSGGVPAPPSTSGTALAGTGQSEHTTVSVQAAGTLSFDHSTHSLAFDCQDSKSMSSKGDIWSIWRSSVNVAPKASRIAESTAEEVCYYFERENDQAGNDFLRHPKGTINLNWALLDEFDQCELELLCPNDFDENLKEEHCLAKRPASSSNDVENDVDDNDLPPTVAPTPSSHECPDPSVTRTNCRDRLYQEAEAGNLGGHGDNFCSLKPDHSGGINDQCRIAYCKNTCKPDCEPDCVPDVDANDWNNGYHQYRKP